MTNRTKPKTLGEIKKAEISSASGKSVSGRPSGYGLSFHPYSFWTGVSVAVATALLIPIGIQCAGLCKLARDYPAITQEDARTLSGIDASSRGLDKDGGMENILEYDGRFYRFILDNESAPTVVQYSADVEKEIK